ncbi:hypothetical protein PAXINDRAFT_16559 [Paxillus involutus ATCC 200175]|uniref:Extracellular metalloproteinase n=1 Tax=Paxillus involutus ATCC 200175 TaxID=664439 RepID=A0A0C9TI87_PAXIN|nr:hypothetical protein PAXINDRAFT_16559 [Paxillus involutus ATCC 200175]
MSTPREPMSVPSKDALGTEPLTEDNLQLRDHQETLHPDNAAWTVGSKAMGNVRQKDGQLSVEDGNVTVQPSESELLLPTDSGDEVEENQDYGAARTQFLLHIQPVPIKMIVLGVGFVIALGYHFIVHNVHDSRIGGIVPVHRQHFPINSHLRSHEVKVSYSKIDDDDIPIHCESFPLTHKDLTGLAPKDSGNSNYPSNHRDRTGFNDLDLDSDGPPACEPPVCEDLPQETVDVTAITTTPLLQLLDTVSLNSEQAKEGADSLGSPASPTNSSNHLPDDDHALLGPPLERNECKIWDINHFIGWYASEGEDALTHPPACPQVQPGDIFVHCYGPHRNIRWNSKLGDPPNHVNLLGTGVRAQVERRERSLIFIYAICFNTDHVANSHKAEHPLSYGRETIKELGDTSPTGWHTLPVSSDPSVEESDRAAMGDSFWRTTNTTWGNNIFTHENWDGRNAWMYNRRPEGSVEAQMNITLTPSVKFSYPYAPNPADTEEDSMVEAQSHIDDTVTQLFYTSNMAHDLFYRYGFTEAASSFQQYNFGRGGAEGNIVIANTQDGSGFNNVNFMTPPDGQNGHVHAIDSHVSHCQMYLWNTVSPYPDGDMEAGIVIHELAHGPSTRLTGRPKNSGCLGWNESGGTGEGSGDFIATSIRSTSTYSDYGQHHRQPLNVQDPLQARLLGHACQNPKGTPSRPLAMGRSGFVADQGIGNPIAKDYYLQSHGELLGTVDFQPAGDDTMFTKIARKWVKVFRRKSSLDTLDANELEAA